MEERKSGLRLEIRTASEMVYPEEVSLRRGYLNKDRMQMKEGVVWKYGEAGRGDNLCKDPEAGPCLVCLRLKSQ